MLYCICILQFTAIILIEITCKKNLQMKPSFNQNVDDCFALSYLKKLKLWQCIYNKFNNSKNFYSSNLNKKQHCLKWISKIENTQCRWETRVHVLASRCRAHDLSWSRSARNLNAPARDLLENLLEFARDKIAITDDREHS